MDKQQKINRKIRRCEKRRAKRKREFNYTMSLGSHNLSIGQVRQQYKYGHFYNDYGELKQVCSYQGICNYPCNGDC